MLGERHKHATHLYVYEGCSKHGCKVGVGTARSLAGRLIGCRRRCKQSAAFAQVWELPNANAVEQVVIGVLESSDRCAPPGEEWFHVQRDEMLDAVGFAMELLDPDKSQPRHYRMRCGFVTKATEH